jgi:hypothetical protein
MRKVPGNALALQAIWVPQKTATRSWSGHLPRAVLHRRHEPVARHDARRLAGHPRNRQGRVAQANLLWDVLAVMRQAGVWPLSPRWGVEGMWQDPVIADGVRRAPPRCCRKPREPRTDAGDAQDAGTLGRDALIAMPQRDHGHPGMMGCGLAGIGTTRGLDGLTATSSLSASPFTARRARSRR